MRESLTMKNFATLSPGQVGGATALRVVVVTGLLMFPQVQDLGEKEEEEGLNGIVRG